MKPVVGRVYRPEEYHDDGQQVILSYGFWQRRFGSDPGVLGKTLYLNHAATQVIGVMPRTADIFKSEPALGTGRCGRVFHSDHVPHSRTCGIRGVVGQMNSASPPPP